MAQDSGNNQGGGDDIIPLDKLVGDAAGNVAPRDPSVEAQPPTTAQTSPTAAAPVIPEPIRETPVTAAPAAVEPAPLDIATVDNILDQITPGFTDGLNDLKDLKAEDAHAVTADPVIDKLVAQERSAANAKGFKRLLIRVAHVLNLIGAYFVVGASQIAHGLVALAKLLKKGSVAGFHTSKKGAVKAKSGIKSFMALPLKIKFLSVVCVALSIGLFVVLKVTVRGTALPKIEMPLLRSFADVADAKYSIEENEAWEDLNDPLFHPEHVVAIDRVVANLRPPGDGSNPMVLMDLFIEAGNKEGAIEIKVHEAEARDVISRTLEQMPYDELATPAGKTKIKVLLRQKLNEFLKQGRVRRVLLKTIVLKP